MPLSWFNWGKTQRRLAYSLFCSSQVELIGKKRVKWSFSPLCWVCKTNKLNQNTNLLDFISYDKSKYYVKKRDVCGSPSWSHDIHIHLNANVSSAPQSRQILQWPDQRDPPSILLPLFLLLTVHTFILLPSWGRGAKFYKLPSCSGRLHLWGAANPVWSVTTETLFSSSSLWINPFISLVLFILLGLKVLNVYKPRDNSQMLYLAKWK